MFVLYSKHIEHTFATFVRTITERTIQGETIMKKYQNVYAKQDTQQKHIVLLFCFSIAVVMLFIISFRTINAQAAPAEVMSKYYTSVRIEAGDTLWGIASNYITDDYKDMNQYIQEICSINHICKDEIRAGEYLIIPYYAP